MATAPFKLKSGNTTPFKTMGSSPLKQDYVKDIYHAKYNPSGKKFLDVAKKGVDPAITGTEIIGGAKAHEPVKNVASKGSKGVIGRTISNISKHTPKIVKTLGRGVAKAFLPLTIAESLYSFGKTSVERKKAGLGGFNFPKPPTPKKGKGFNF
jgi:hypothetical protein